MRAKRPRTPGNTVDSSVTRLGGTSRGRQLWGGNVKFEKGRGQRENMMSRCGKEGEPVTFSCPFIIKPEECRERHFIYTETEKMEGALGQAEEI